MYFKLFYALSSLQAHLDVVADEVGVVHGGGGEDVGHRGLHPPRLLLLLQPNILLTQPRHKGRGEISPKFGNCQK